MSEMKNAKQYFNESAAAWDEKPARVEMAKAVSAKIISQVKPGKEMSAMEFGCGTGLITMAVAPAVGQVLAVDMSENMLAVLDEKVRQNKIDNVATRLLDLSKGELPEETFDLIFSSMVLHHVKDVDALLGVFHRLLNPGGVIALADLDAEDGGFHGDIPDVFHLGFDRDALTEKLRKNGFSDIDIITAHVMKKESATTGKETAFPVFLAVAKKKSP